MSLTEPHAAYLNVEKLPSRTRTTGKRYSYFNIVHVYCDIVMCNFDFHLVSAFPVSIFVKLRFQPSENVLF
jgi:hypothetical protein